MKKQLTEIRICRGSRVDTRDFQRTSINILRDIGNITTIKKSNTIKKEHSKDTLQKKEDEK